MQKLLFFILIFINASITFCQEVLLEENVQDITANIDEYGPNLKKFRHIYFEWGFPVSKSEGTGAEVNVFRSSTFEIGFRQKRKISNYYSVGWSFYYNNLIYNLVQDQTKKQIPNNITHKKESLRFNHLGLEFYNRLNFGRRGNSIGKFMDIGAFGNWAFSARQIYVDDISAAENNYQAQEKKVIVTGLKYINKLNYGLKARLGINRYVISATYRISTGSALPVKTTCKPRVRSHCARAIQPATGHIL